MYNPRVLLNKALVIGVFILFIGISVASSTGNNVENISFNTQVLNEVENSEGLLLSGKIAYAYIAYSGDGDDPEGPCYFALNDPGNITHLSSFSGDFLSGGTWTTDGRWLCCEYGGGVLWELDPVTGDSWSIGGGGINCPGLAWDPIYNRLYATTGTQLLEYNTNTGEQMVIGNHSLSNKTMIALAINSEGICYAWDIHFSTTSTLWTIDLDTGKATEVASMGETLTYAQDGAFDWDTGVLYLAAYHSKGQLKTCDLETGELTLIGDFEGGAELTALAIPYNWSGVPFPDFNWTPTPPNPDETVLFNASGSNDPDGYITLYEWDWDNDGIFDENHTNPTTLHSWPIEGYYPVTLRITDNTSLTGMKTKIIKIENNPPNAPIIIGYDNGSLFLYSIDPDDDDVFYFIDWDDGTNSSWIGPFKSGEVIEISHEWHEGIYNVKAKAKDIYGEESLWSDTYTIIIVNQPPEPPTITGQRYGDPQQQLTYTFVTDDFEGHSVKYFIDWDDGTTSETGYYESGTPATVTHSWETKKDYHILARAIDVENKEGDWSVPYHIRIGDQPPTKPDIEGPSRGIQGTNYIFVFTAEDPENDKVWYNINWGDESETTDGPYLSGTPITKSHIWNATETYKIQARTKDNFDYYGEWAEYSFIITRNRALNLNQLEWLFERFPILQRLLKLIV